MNRNQAARSAITYINFLRSVGIEMTDATLQVEATSTTSQADTGSLRSPTAQRAEATTDTGKADTGGLRPPTEPATSTPAGGSTLAQLTKEVANCKACGLAETRTNTVFGTGSGSSGIMFVGEAPGADEDAQGKPFVGRAGQLLTRMIEAIEFKRQDVFIANVLKCRPPENRDPKPAEVEACEHFLIKQIAIIKPLIICTLGKHATQTLLKTEEPIGRLRGKLHSYNNVPLIPTYHPAFLLRSPQYKKLAWEDLQMLRDERKRLAAGRDS